MEKKSRATELAEQFCQAAGLSPHAAAGDKSRVEALAEWLVDSGLVKSSDTAKSKGGDK